MERDHRVEKTAVPANLLALKLAMRNIRPHLAWWIILGAVFNVIFCGSLIGIDLMAAENSLVEIAGVRDFVEYWSASRLLLSGGNSFDPKKFITLQTTGGLHSTAH